MTNQTWEYVEDSEHAQYWLGMVAANLADRKAMLALDTETTGLSRERQVKLVSIAHDQPSSEGGGAPKTLVIAWSEANDVHLKEFLLQVARMPLVSLVAHNARFDLMKLMTRQQCQFFYERDRVRDTSIAMKVWKPDESASLKNAAKNVLGEPPDEHDYLQGFFKHSGYDWGTVPTTNKLYQAYAAKDAELALRLAGYMEEHGLWTEAVSRETFVDYLYQLMADRGLRVDMEAAGALKGKLADRLETLKDDLSRRGVNSLGSHTEVARALGVEGYKSGGVTRTGKAKLDRTSLKRLQSRGSRVAALILEHRKLKKVFDMVEQLTYSASEHEHVCRPHVRAVGAITGRSSISRPALQQLHKEDKRIRSLIIADEGARLVSIDYSQIELRALAEMSRDTRMVNALREGRDLHAETAKVLFQRAGGDTRTENAKTQHRHIAKTINFAMVYGAGPKLISARTGLSYSNAQMKLDQWFDHYPGVRAWVDELKSAAEASGHVILPDGRQIPVPEGKSYVAVNYMIQGYAAQILKSAVLDLEEHGFWGFARLVIHDEVLFSFPAKTWESFATDAMDIMTRTINGIPYPVEATAFKSSWGEELGTLRLPPEPESNAVTPF